MATVTSEDAQPLKSPDQTLETLYRQAKGRLDALRQDIKAEINKALKASRDRTVAKVKPILQEV